VRPFCGSLARPLEPRRAAASCGAAGELLGQVPGRPGRLPRPVNLPVARSLPAMMHGKSTR